MSRGRKRGQGEDEQGKEKRDGDGQMTEDGRTDRFSLANIILDFGQNGEKHFVLPSRIT